MSACPPKWISNDSVKIAGGNKGVKTRAVRLVKGGSPAGRRVRDALPEGATNGILPGCNSEVKRCRWSASALAKSVCVCYHLFMAPRSEIGDRARKILADAESNTVPALVVYGDGDSIATLSPGSTGLQHQIALLALGGLNEATIAERLKVSEFVVSETLCHPSFVTHLQAHRRKAMSKFMAGQLGLREAFGNAVARLSALVDDPDPKIALKAVKMFMDWQDKALPGVDFSEGNTPAGSVGVAALKVAARAVCESDPDDDDNQSGSPSVGAGGAGQCAACASGAVEEALEEGVQ